MYNTERLNEIKDEMINLLEEATDIIRGTSEEDRARGYWYASIRMALDDDHSFLGSSVVTMQSSIEALELINKNQEDMFV